MYMRERFRGEALRVTTKWYCNILLTSVNRSPSAILVLSPTGLPNNSHSFAEDYYMPSPFANATFYIISSSPSLSPLCLSSNPIQSNLISPIQSNPIESNLIYPSPYLSVRPFIHPSLCDIDGEHVVFRGPDIAESSS